MQVLESLKWISQQDTSPSSHRPQVMHFSQTSIISVQQVYILRPSTRHSFCSLRMIFSFSIKTLDDQRNRAVINCCAGFRPGAKLSLMSKQMLLKSFSDATGATDKPDHGWTPEQRCRAFQALSPYWWHESEIKEIKRAIASGSIDLAGSSCYNQSPSQKHAPSPLHCTPIIFVLEHVPKSLSPRCLNPIYTVLVWRLTFSPQVNCRLKGPAGGELLFQPGKLMFIWCHYCTVIE